MTLPASGPLALTDIQTEFGGTNPIGLNEYYAGGGLVPAGTSGTYGTVPSSGALSVQNFYGTTAFTPVYIEEVFSTYLYTGNGSTQTITNGIDLSTKGGLVWIKNRGGYSHALFDTSRGVENLIKSNTTEAQSALSGSLTSFTSSGFSLGSAGIVNDGSGTYPNNVSWTFRKQPKFFDVVTYTGNGTAPRNISHNLGSVPGCIMIKRTDTTSTWTVYHAGIGNTKALFLNADAAADTNSAYWNNTTPTSTVFTLGGTFGDINANGATYVAYLFAHNAGGFGLTGTDNVITCGSFTTTSGGIVPEVNLGYEPQWVMVKRTDSTGPWFLLDTMRGYALTNTQYLYANASIAEANWSTPYLGYPTATGFKGDVNSGIANGTFIYIAIRRGPMKVPTSGTSVFSSVTRTGTGANATISGVGFAPDVLLSADRNSAPQKAAFYDKLRGVGTQGGGAALLTSSSTFEQNYTDALLSYTNTGVNVGAEASTVTINYSGEPFVTWFFQRAPSFFDEVCYTGVGGTASFNHNLGVAPELIFVKSRSAANGGLVYNKTITASKYLKLFFTSEGDRAVVNDTGGFAGVEPTSSVFTVGFYGNVNTSGATYVAYLFATCAGVSKVGSYTGTGALQTVNCGFTSGARFVLIKRTDSTGDWYTYDSARGISSGNDPYLLLNSAAAEVTGTNYVDTTSVGFQVTAAAPAGLNASGGTYIFLAIA